MPDHRSKHQKLRDVINHPRTSEHEREAARLALQRLGPEPRPEPTFGAPRPAPKRRGDGYDDLRQRMRYMSMDELMRMWRQQMNRSDQAARMYNEAINNLRRDGNPASEAMRRANEELRRREAATAPPCPGCGHPEASHVSFRCYACGLNEKQPEGPERTAKACNWMYGRVSGMPAWIQLGGAFNG